ncbi:hypothetical protein V3C33_12985 [Micrococcaceae bacterium Sec5.7]
MSILASRQYPGGPKAEGKGGAERSGECRRRNPDLCGRQSTKPGERTCNQELCEQSEQNAQHPDDSYEERSGGCGAA